MKLKAGWDLVPGAAAGICSSCLASGLVSPKSLHVAVRKRAGRFVGGLGSGMT